jgi:hypothetical protein
MRIFSRRLVCLVGVVFFGSASSTGAQVLPYKFVRIADTVTLPAGTVSLPFGVTTSAVAASTSATIKASANGTKKSKKLIVNPS